MISLLLPCNLRASTNTPLSYFVIYYQNLLEFSTCATMGVNGLVYCKSNIYVGAGGSSAALTFEYPVLSAGTITAPANNGWAWTGPTNYVASNWRTYFNGTPPNLINMPRLQVALPSIDPHSLIDVPVTDDSSTPSGRLRLYNQAQVVLTISNTTPTTLPGTNIVVSLKIQKAPTPDDVPGADPSPVSVTYTNPTPAIFSNNFPFLSLTNIFYDAREKTTNITAQIDVGRYKFWLTNSFGLAAQKYPPLGIDGFPTILFVADNRNTSTAGGKKLTVVRLTNGIAPPRNGGLGFSVATPNPLYVWGNYNQTNSALLGITNTSSGVVPCAFYCDAITILSSGWSDFQSFHNGYTAGNEIANDATINAAIVAGIVPSTGIDLSHFSGGVHNFPRLLEDWNHNTLTLNTSLINLYNSTRAIGVFANPGLYYSPPDRQFCHDPRFLNPANTPPGMPTASIGSSPLLFSAPLQTNALFAGDSVFSHPLAVGYGPITYQWSLNGTNLDGATNAVLSLINIQDAQAGTYTVTAADSVGTNSAAMLSFTVTDIKPLIDSQPASQAVLVGADVIFAASVIVGTSPITWQWQFNQTNIDDATNATLTLTNVTTDQAGIYSVLATNAIGTTVSSNATLSVYTSATSTMDSSSLTAGNQIQFTINGMPGLKYAVQASTDMVNWDSIQTNISPFDFTDTNTVNLPQRFYRAVYLP